MSCFGTLIGLLGDRQWWWGVGDIITPEETLAASRQQSAQSFQLCVVRVMLPSQVTGKVGRMSHCSCYHPSGCQTRMTIF